LFSASETNAITIHSQGSNDGLKAILGAIVAGGDSASSSCDDCSKPKCGCSKKVKKSSHSGAEAARKVIEKATDDLERKAEEREN
jgi:hypothetical protein